MNFIIYLFYPVVILLIFTYFFVINKQSNLIFTQNYKFLFYSTIVFFCLGNIILFIYFKNERFIYYWDYATFWEQSLKLNNLINVDSIEAFKFVINSMNYQEYTALPALFISLPTTFIGQSFFAFVLSSFNFFVIPFYILLTLFELTLINKLKLKIPSKWILMLVNFMFIPFYFTLFHGYIGIVGQIFITSLFLIFLTKENELELPEIIIINGLTFLLIFTRRWYLFWVVSYYLGSGLYILYSKRKTINELLYSLIKIFFSGVIMLIFILLFFLPFLSNIFVSNVSTLYASYKLPSLLDEFIRFKNFYGLFIIFMSVFGLYVSLRNKSSIIWFILIVTFLTTLQFMSIQSFEFHHYNLINFGVFILTLLGIISLIQKKSLMIIILILYSVNAIYVFTPKIELINLFFIPSSLYPKIRTDISEIQDLANYLNQLTLNNKYAYCAASSPFINDDLLRNAQLPWITNSIPNLEGSSNNDIRDGFPESFFDVNFVLVTDPVQINSSYIDKQYVNQLINDSVLNLDIIRDNYQLIYENRISEVKIYIFERIGNYDSYEKLYFYNKLKVMYPDNPYIYEKILTQGD